MYLGCGIKPLWKIFKSICYFQFALEAWHLLSFASASILGVKSCVKAVNFRMSFKCVCVNLDSSLVLLMIIGAKNCINRKRTIAFKKLYILYLLSSFSTMTFCIRCDSNHENDDNKTKLYSFPSHKFEKFSLLSAHCNIIIAEHRLVKQITTTTLENRWGRCPGRKREAGTEESNARGKFQ